MKRCFFWLPHPKNAHVSRNKGTFPKGKKGELVVSGGVHIAEYSF